MDGNDIEAEIAELSRAIAESPDDALLRHDRGLARLAASQAATDDEAAAELLALAEEDLSRAIELGEGQDEAAQAGGRHSVRAGRLVESIGAAIDRLNGRLAALDSQTARHGERERHREWGELIYGYLWQIRPGDTELVVDGQRIPLDPALDPKEQARRYLHQYQEGKSADAHIGAARTEAELELRYLEQLRTLAQQAVSIQDIEDLEAEWRARQPAAASSRPPEPTLGAAQALGRPACGCVALRLVSDFARDVSRMFT